MTIDQSLSVVTLLIVDNFLNQVECREIHHNHADSVRSVGCHVSINRVRGWSVYHEVDLIRQKWVKYSSEIFRTVPTIPPTTAPVVVDDFSSGAFVWSFEKRVNGRPFLILIDIFPVILRFRIRVIDRNTILLVRIFRDSINLVWFSSSFPRPLRIVAQ